MAKEVKEMKENWLCIRRCLYHAGDPKQQVYKIYNPGDPLRAGAPPGRHFAIDGEPDEDVGANPIMGPGDDIRSTKQIVEDLNSKYDIKMKSTTRRKIVFKKWIEMEAESRNAEEVKKLEVEAKAEAETLKQAQKK